MTKTKAMPKIFTFSALERTNMLRRLISRLTMKKIGYAFTDVVDGRPVFYWTDKYGSYWLAQTRLGMRILRDYQRATEANRKKKGWTAEHDYRVRELVKAGALIAAEIDRLLSEAKRRSK